MLKLIVIVLGVFFLVSVAACDSATHRDYAFRAASTSQDGFTVSAQLRGSDTETEEGSVRGAPYELWLRIELPEATSDCAVSIHQIMLVNLDTGGSRKLLEQPTGKVVKKTAHESAEVFLLLPGLELQHSPHMLESGFSFAES